MTEWRFNLGAVDLLLVETLVEARFTPDTIPSYQADIPVEVVHQALLGPVQTLANAFAEDLATDLDGYRNVDEILTLVQGVGTTLDAIAPLTQKRRGEFFPHTYRLWADAGAGHEYAKQRADEPMYWSDWIGSISRDLAHSAIPEPHSGTR